LYAVYSRQSVDKQDSISIESQIEFCKYELRGQPYREYIDKGYSGKNIERPEFQRLLADIKKGEIKKVVVYKLDRISRSILDFSNLMVLFQKYDVEFISSTEKFDTSSPMGRAMLNICIVFAQLERETIQKRIADAYISRSQKGFYMGGRVNYGFEKVSTIMQGVKTSMYVIKPEEAEHIKLMYEIYSDYGASYGDILKHFKEKNIINLRKGSEFVSSRIHEYLQNPVYVRADESVYEFYQQHGVEITNDISDFVGTNGCYYYKGQNATGKKHYDLAGNVIVLAPHEGIVDADLWLACKKKTMGNKTIQPGRRVVKMWLAGKIKCGHCGHALTRKDYQKNPIGSYYFCTKRMNNINACIGVGGIYADEFEALVLNHLKERLGEFKTLAGKVSSKKINPKITTLQIQLRQVEDEITKLLASLTTANDTLVAYVNGMIVDLDKKKQSIISELSKAESQGIDKAQILHVDDCIEKWEELELTDKRIVVDVLIEAIHATKDSLTISWKF